MNIEIANKLQKLRKEKGYSQEQLAEELGISRQAVSKWERAESSPDTDNLICLAKLYGISLDELLATDKTVEEIREDVILNGQKESIENDTNESISKSYNKNEKLVIILTSALPSLIIVILYLTISSIWDLWHPGWILFLFIPIISSIGKVIVDKDPSKFAYPVLVTACYLFFSFKYGIFHPLWVIFLTIPVYSTLCKIFKK